MHRDVLPTHSGTAGRNAEKEGTASTLLCCPPVLAEEEEEKGEQEDREKAPIHFPGHASSSVLGRQSSPFPSFPEEEVEAHTLMHWG